MKIIYKQPIALKIAEAIDAAAQQDKKIEMILLTKAEMTDLVEYMNRTSLRLWNSPIYRVTQYQGIDIREEA